MHELSRAFAKVCSALSNFRIRRTMKALWQLLGPIRKRAWQIWGNCYGIENWNECKLIETFFESMYNIWDWICSCATHGMMEYDDSIFFRGCDDMIMLLRIRHHISRGAVLLFAAAEAKVIHVELRQHSFFQLAYLKGRSEVMCCSITIFFFQGEDYLSSWLADWIDKNDVVRIIMAYFPPISITWIPLLSLRHFWNCPWLIL